jgi:hypothetical protein
MTRVQYRTRDIEKERSITFNQTLGTRKVHSMFPGYP